MENCLQKHITALISAADTLSKKAEESIVKKEDVTEILNTARGLNDLSSEITKILSNLNEKSKEILANHLIGTQPDDPIKASIALEYTSGVVDTCNTLLDRM